MTEHWRTELQRLMLVLAACALLGWLLGDARLGIIAGLLGYASWTLRHLRKLENWLQHGMTVEPPSSTGFWGHVFDAIYRLRQEERREQDRLRAAIDHLQEAFRALDDAVVMLDSGGNIEWFNPAARHLLGLIAPRDEGTQLTNLLRDPGFIRYFDAEDYAEALVLKSPANAETTLEVHIAFFGRRNRVLFVRNITRLHQLEIMRKDFVANMSHELKTPLTVLTGYLEALSGTPMAAEPRWQRVFSQMMEQSHRMERLLNDLLLLSRLESLPRQQSESISLAGFLRDIATETSAAFGNRAIPVDCAEGIHLQGNTQELYSAFSNLLSNACKYAPEGEVRVRVDRSTAGGIVVAVQDSGLGIEARHIPRLTERFYRVDDSRHTETGGTGLGLAIVKHVLARHDAELHISSQLGKGSVFSCLFPPERVS